MIRRAKQKMTGSTPKQIVVVLGEFTPRWKGCNTADGARQIKIEAGWDTYICISDPKQLAELRRDLDTAARYLDCKPVILEGEEEEEGMSGSEDKHEGRWEEHESYSGQENIFWIACSCGWRSRRILSRLSVPRVQEDFRRHWQDAAAAMSGAGTEDGEGEGES